MKSFHANPRAVRTPMQYLAQLLALSCVLALAPGQLHAQQATRTRYTITDLGPLPGGDLSDARAINADGLVVGSSTVDANGTPHAVAWQNGTITDLGTLDGQATSSTAQAVNTSGQSSGSATRTSGGLSVAVRWSVGNIEVLGTLGGRLSFANGIDSAGRVVGGSEISNARAIHPFLWASGVMTDLGLLASATSGAATAINDRGQVVGSAGHAFLWQTGVLTDLGSLPGGTTSEARAINNLGQIVGSSGMASGGSRATLWRNGSVIDLGTLDTLAYSVANGINDQGQIVGTADLRCSPCAPPRAFIWQEGSMQVLDSLIPTDSGWKLETATAINNAGQIAGSGVVNGLRHGFLLTPVPVATPCAVAPLGLAGSYNIFSLGKLTQPGGSAEGAVAAGGSTILTNYQLGAGLPSDETTNALVAGSNLWYLGGTVIRGNIVYSGSLTISNVDLGTGSIRRRAPIDFAAATQTLRQRSADLAALAPTGTATVSQTVEGATQVVLTGSDAIHNTFTLTNTQLAGAKRLVIRVPEGASALVNIGGESLQLSHVVVTLEGTHAPKVLYNLVDARNVVLQETVLPGSLLAPQAALGSIRSTINGSLIAAAVYGPLQATSAPFTGCLPVPKALGVEQNATAPGSERVYLPVLVRAKN